MSVAGKEQPTAPSPPPIAAFPADPSKTAQLHPCSTTEVPHQHSQDEQKGPLLPQTQRLADAAKLPPQSILRRTDALVPTPEEGGLPYGEFRGLLEAAKKVEEQEEAGLKWSERVQKPLDELVSKTITRMRQYLAYLE